MSDENALAEANEIDDEVKFAPDAAPYIERIPGFVRGVALKSMTPRPRKRASP